MTFSLTSHRPLHPVLMSLVLALWLSTVGNAPLWMAMLGLPESNTPRAWLGVAGFGLVLLAATVAFLSLVVWPRWRKPVGLVLLVTTAFSSYFMFSYGVVIDPSMLANAVQTDAREVRDLLSWSMLPVFMLGVALPGWWWWKQPVRQIPVKSLLVRQTGLAVLATLVMLVMVWLSFQDLASTMRNHKSLRYMVNPFNTVYATTRLVLGRTAHASQAVQPIGEDATLMGSASDVDKSPLIVLVVGETVRAANVGLAGYARDTTPRLRQLQDRGELVYFSNVSSCGTNTQVSVPCMFSGLGREAYGKTGAQFENLLDVVQRAGLAVLWLDNQSGCKGVCDRVPHAEIRELKDSALCPEGECFDEEMLRVLPERLALLDPVRRARGTVVVMHQMGSHGPAYYKRTPTDFKVFMPECRSNVLQECSGQEIVNAYDNSVRYTDHFLGQTVAWLKEQKRPTALVYVSDHGESLGEKGLYLHGMPHAMAPKEQTSVPMAAWFSQPMLGRLGWDQSCWQGQATQPITHDNLFSSMLTLAQVQTHLYDPQLDVFSACTSAHRQGQAVAGSSGVKGRETQTLPVTVQL
ncbi:phosphoethanolamine--lipid A transferase [Rhodoferax sp.]|uniref:phosphoethanolamine transferase n=1 Tax=Rhodoferax sp. TaxID=50421 RepID=UPI0025F70553|nr:phosphoethanolamine--lipid A transferase [Rhodoferax sp.]